VQGKAAKEGEEGKGLSTTFGVGNISRSTWSPFPFQAGFYLEGSCFSKIYCVGNVEVERDVYVALRLGL